MLGVVNYVGFCYVVVVVYWYDLFCEVIVFCDVCIGCYL